uniref:Uncharacterized protein n=1 Tax=Dipterosiphonia australica TaxID=2007208 RepID=A0A1Z1MLX6_9FLOR|nr:hypothetical protein [Dipterosiphonia australica]ARW66936.1 hypothetical protein [Dipterosiphonia australica]
MCNIYLINQEKLKNFFMYNYFKNRIKFFIHKMLSTTLIQN